MRLGRPIRAIILCVAATFGAGAPAADPSTEASAFFETRVRPVLVAHCYECHGPQSKFEGNLRVDSRAALLKGGTIGPAIKPGDPKGSLLVDAINHGDVVQMPPKSKLSAVQIADLTTWVAGGAPWPGSEPVASADGHASAAPATVGEGRDFWAFQPPRLLDPPPVNETRWVQSPIDRFVLAGLEANALHPAPAADKRQLIRRATFDLHGLPPTIEEVEAFLADASPGAFARVVDRLLASPRYGERWGRRWLDLARYADSNGMDENMAMAHAWRYRDYVVSAFNRDLPYDQFICQQLAGDLLPAVDDAAALEGLVATGFLVLGPKMLAEDDPVKMEMDIIDEQVDTIGRAVLGLSLGCARCHDHKFDPIPTTDYYALAGIFKSTKTMENHSVVAMWSERPLATPAEIARLAAHDALAASVAAKIKAHQDAANKILFDQLQDALTGALLPKFDLQPLGRLLVGSPVEQLVAPPHAERYYAADVRAALAALGRERAELEKTRPKLAQALAVAERRPEDLRVHIRGSHLTLGDVVPRRFPTVLAGDAQPPIGRDSSGRLELARWITRADHPLTSRVMVNRIWQGHFGEGLVRSPDNFGRLGERPDNQPLLDWLACRFVASGWSIKSMHREIMLSNAYQMSTAHNPQGASIDPENRLLWRMNRRRLEAEEVRDAILAVAGQIDYAMSGTLLANANHTYVTSTASVRNVSYENNRRSIYLPVVRSAVYEVLSAFDFADPSTMNGKRAATTVAPQALFMMNSPLVLRETRALAESLCNEHSLDQPLVERLYLRAYSRPPGNSETARVLEFLKRYSLELAGQNVATAEVRVRAWQAVCRVVFASNEFIYLE
jgi:mono/diheme cytochrome c family protein